MSALYDYDATQEAMRRIVVALFADPAYAADDAYVLRRHESATLPGAWEAIAAARFRRPGAQAPPTASSARRYDRIAVPTLVVHGTADKAVGIDHAEQAAARIPGATFCRLEGADHLLMLFEI